MLERFPPDLLFYSLCRLNVVLEVVFTPNGLLLPLCAPDASWKQRFSFSESLVRVRQGETQTEFEFPVNRSHVH